MNAGKPGVLHGNRTYLLQNADGQILDGHSISAGSTIPASARNIPGCAIPAASNTMCRSADQDEALESPSS
jgi:tryptophan synthase beta subunit